MTCFSRPLKSFLRNSTSSLIVSADIEQIWDTDAGEFFPVVAFLFLGLQIRSGTESFNSKSLAVVGPNATK